MSPETIQNCSLSELDTESNRNVLRTYGFHSLVAILTDPSDVPLKVNDIKPTQNSYHAVVDGKGIMDRALLRNARRQAGRPNWIASDTAKRF